MTSHIKLLKGYGISIRQKDHQILLANGKDPFTGEQNTESYYIPQIPYEKSKKPIYVRLTILIDIK